MVMVFTVQVRVTKELREQFKQQSKQYGFDSMSKFIRYLALEYMAEREAKSADMHMRVKELHRHFLGEQPRPKFKKNGAVAGC